MAQAIPIGASAVHEDTVLRLNRRFAAPRERVFRAFTDVAELQKWWGPEGFACPVAELDARPGGKFRLEMHSPTGGIHVVFGEYREVNEPERLVYTFAWEDSDGPETLVTLDFVDHGAETELTLTHSLFADREARDNHNQGWASSFNDLESYLAS